MVADFGRRRVRAPLRVRDTQRSRDGCDASLSLLCEGLPSDRAARREDKCCTLAMCPLVQCVQRVSTFRKQDAYPAVTGMSGGDGCNH